MATTKDARKLRNIFSFDVFLLIRMEVTRVFVIFALLVMCCDCASLKTGEEDIPLTFNADGGYRFS